MRYWQRCPICEGSGMVSGGFFGSPGYYDEYGNRHWTSNNAAETCRVCQGQGIIETPENKEKTIEVQ